MADSKSSTARLRSRPRLIGCRRWIRTRSLIIALILLVIGICLSPSVVPPPPQWSSVVPSASSGIRALILTAHPDDECMFFSPTILSLVKQDVHVKALCLSRGNAAGLGDIRAQELISSYRVLGLNDSDVRVVNHVDLQDSMNAIWDAQVISSVLKRYLQTNPVDIIITFDTGGITRHPNHTPLSLGVQQLFRTLPFNISAEHDSRTRRPRLMTLQTVPRSIKFTSVLYPVYETLSYHVCSSTPTRKDNDVRSPATVLAITSPIVGYRQALQAMMQHRSQLVWFRWLYVSFSKYMWSNRLIEVDLSA